MSRPSAAAIATLSSAVPSSPLPPPAYLSEEEAGYWREIVEALPPDRFGGANSCLLVEYVRSLGRSRQLHEEIRTMRDWKLTEETKHGAQQRSIFRQVLRMAQAETRELLRMATKLRLVSTAYRFDHRYDDRKRAVLPSGPRPWDGN